MQLRFLKVDGGAANNNLKMQYQADILDTAVEHPSTAYLAGFIEPPLL